MTNEKIWPGIPGTEYVLAYWNNGQLRVVDFDREDKHFSRKPRLTAEVLINGKKGIVTIDRITKLVETSQIGRIKRIITKVEEGSPWIGIIGSADNDANDIVFILVRYHIKSNLPAIIIRPIYEGVRIISLKYRLDMSPHMEC